MSEAALLSADVVDLEQQLADTYHACTIYRTALHAALDLLHGAALRLNDQDQQIRQLLGLRG